MNLPFYIAGRYLFAKKSHNVINVISAVSAVGMAIGTAALILILSVYNGFDRIVDDNMSDLDPDILISAASGKFFDPDDAALDVVFNHPSITSAGLVLEDNVFISYEGREGIARARGIDSSYGGDNPIAGHTVEGQFILEKGDVDYAAVGAELAYGLGIHPRFLSPITIYYPGRGETISLSNPSASLHEADVFPGSIFSISSSVDAEMMILPLRTMRRLIGTDKLVSGIELRADGQNAKKLRRELADALGENYRVQDRYMQHTQLYKMMKYEKLAIFLILLFVVLIIAFNIYGSLSMLIIEKKDDIGTLKALGLHDADARRVFVLEGWMVSLLGLAAGLIAGIGLALLQQKTGIVKMPGSFALDAYPVVLQLKDVILTAIGVAAIGLVISLLCARNAKGSGI